MFSILLYEYIIKLEMIKTVYNAIFSKKIVFIIIY